MGSRPWAGAAARTLRAATACLFVLLPATVTSVGAEPPSGREGAIREVVAGLASSHSEARKRALVRLSSMISLDPKAGVRAFPRLRAILRLRGPVERAHVSALLLRVPDPEARKLWLERLDPEVEAHDEVLASAVDAVRQCRADAGLARALLRIARDERSGACRRALALEAMGHLESPATQLALANGRPAETWVEASCRALGLGKRRRVGAIEPLLVLLEHPALAARIHAWESLVRLTGRSLPPEAEAWKAWWAKRDPKKMPALFQPEKAGERYAPATPLHVPRYYTIPIPRPGSRVVFCLDVSQSMYGDGIHEAREELTRTLMDLPSTHTFEIVAFNERVLPWSGRLVRAHPVQKQRAIDYLAGLETTSYTNLYDAVETAFQHAGRGPHPVERPLPLDAIFLLSDGAPNRGRYRTPKQVVEKIGLLSRGDIPVHTVGAGEEVFPLLQAIAEATGGRFVDAFR